MLRGDDEEERPAFFAISQFNLARSDLVPLITTYPDDHEVVYNARERGSGGMMPLLGLLAHSQVVDDCYATVMFPSFNSSLHFTT
jgi:hypothetical protein